MSTSCRRHLAREKALQALYQWQLTEEPVHTVIKKFTQLQAMDRQTMDGVDIEYFEKIVTGVTEKTAEIDRMIEQYVSHGMHDLDPIERTLLRMGSYELMTCHHTPYRVVINEMIELAKKYGSDKGYKLINGVLDKIYSHLTPTPHAS